MDIKIHLKKSAVSSESRGGVSFSTADVVYCLLRANTETSNAPLKMRHNKKIHFSSVWTKFQLGPPGGSAVTSVRVVHWLCEAKKESDVLNLPLPSQASKSETQWRLFPSCLCSSQDALEPISQCLCQQICGRSHILF